MIVLGLSCFYHDAAACIVRDGQVVAAAEEERFTRNKHDFGFPMQAIQFCLKFMGITAAQLDYVVFHEKPGIKLDRILATLAKSFPRNFKLFSDVLKVWGSEKLWISEIIQRRLGIARSKVLFSEHHFSHAASSFYCSPFEDSAILTIDGVGEWITTSFGSASGTNIQRSGRVLFPHSIGLLYSAFTEFLGFEVNDGEFKVMGMAPYGRPIYRDKVEKLFLSRSSNSFELDLDYFSFDSSLETNLKPKFYALFGEGRAQEEPFFIPDHAASLGEGSHNQDLKIIERSRYFADVAASIQSVVEDTLLGFAKGLCSSSSSSNLCIAGGVAYNSVANGRIVREAGFSNYYIQPAAGDSGAAIGAALAVSHTGKSRGNPWVMNSAFLGQAFSLAEIREVLETGGYSFEVCADEDSLCERCAELLAAGKVIGWFQGRFEFGPRALGARSILADPRTHAMKEVVNARVKFRELFRPFAPSCQAEYAKVYFDMTDKDIAQLPYRFMLCVVPVREEYKDKLQAITHVDGSARVQVVSSESNHRYYKLIKTFGALTGIHCVLNTSFNRRGEPIVTTPRDALATFQWSAIDALVLDTCIVKRP